MAPELHSIYDLTTFCRKTTGDVPAKLVGASTTVVGSKMYLFGGRLVTERRMVADLYVFDLETYVWAKIPPFPEDDVPRARYFHSVDTWNNQLIVFGGMSNEPDSPNPDELCVLNDVRFFDIASRHWLPPSRLPTPENLLPRARYAQLSSVTGDRLFIIGGQDFYNTWLDDVCVYDLLAKTWSEKRDYPRHCGSYRSVAVSSTQVVRFPKEEMRVASALGPAGTRFQNGDASPPEDVTPSESLNHLPYSAPPNDEHPSDIYLYSNYNFTDVKRELEIFSPLPDTGFTIEDRSAAMSGTTFPPGLRFPTGAILGTHLIIAGIYLAHSYQSFSIWVLDLQTMVWSRIDPGKAVETGSWFRGCLWPEANKFMIFGNRAGNLVDDYNRRLLSWDHVAVVDLEAFGIYQPPALKLELPMQELGLAALEERVLADFEIICDDGRTLSCSRKLLEDRWPWFKEQRLKLLQSAMGALEGLPNSPMHAPLPALPGTATADRPDPRLTPRALNLSEAYPVALALIQYFYTLALLTPLQTAPAVLSQLLVLSTNYKIPHLQSLVQHAMHRALSNSTSVGVYEVATLCSCRSLQIRALKTVMSYTQKKPSKSRPERAGGGGGGGSGEGGGGGASNRDGGGGGGAEPKYPTRPRGTSDARWAQMGSPDNGARGYGGYNNGGTQRVPMARMLMDDGEQFFTLPPTVKHYAHARSDSQIHRRPRADRHSPAHLVPPAMEDDDDLDELFTLPVSIKEKRLQLQRRHIEEAQKQLSPPQLNRATSRASVVSLHTENELHELMEMIAPPVPSSAIPDVPQRQISDQQIMDELYESLRASSLSTPNPSDMSDAEDSYPSSSRASAAYESEYESDAMPTSLGGFSYHLPRRRTEVRGSLSLSLSPSMAPSLSSASSSSSSQADSARPRTPLSQDGHGPFALPIIQERYPDGDADDVDEQRQFLDARAARPWPKQKSKVEWLPPQTVEEEQITIQPRVAVTEKRGPNVRVVTDAGKRATSPTPSSETVSPRAITTSFTRMLTRKRSPSDATKSPVSIASSKSPVSPASSQFFDKAQKAEEKRRKKEASKARTEELARTLKERTRQAREDAERMSLRSKERNKEPPAMYGGVADGLTL